MADQSEQTPGNADAEPDDSRGAREKQPGDTSRQDGSRLSDQRQFNDFALI